MPQALVLTNKISQQSTRQTIFRTLVSSFGNGYEQRSPDGINNKLVKWDLVWENLTSAEVSSLTTVFDTVGGWDYITYTDPVDSTSKRFKLSDGYSVSPKAGLIFDVSATLIQVFDV